jgi:drug/metabolite transporter (DMT)-like permease
MIHERWGIWGLIGAVLILAGMVVSEISSINFFFMRKPENTYNSIVKT